MKYLDEYKGAIVDVDDPKGLGRARIRVKGLMDGIPDGNLPWAFPKSHEVSVKGGSSDILVKGQKTWVRYLEGDLNYPVFHGGVIETKADLPKNVKAKRAIIYESPNKRITLTVNEDLEDIEIKLGDFNTTLGTIIRLFLDHVHAMGTPAAPGWAGVATKTSVPLALGGLVSYPTYMPDLVGMAKELTNEDFNKGNLI